MKVSDRLKVEKVVSTSQVRECRRFLAEDPAANVLPLGDLYKPLLRVSEIYIAAMRRQIVGVLAVYRGFSTPSIVLAKAAQETKQLLLDRAVKEIPEDKSITPCQPEDVKLFEKHFRVLHSHLEQQMLTRQPKNIRNKAITVTRVGRNELELLSQFYVENGAEAWTPIQFEAGPYYCVKDSGRVVSAAGVHLVTSQIAQLGNIVTDKAYRNGGLASACTSVLSKHLARSGRMISLFVRIDNASAIHMYEKLGFVATRKITFLVMQKK